MKILYPPRPKGRVESARLVQYEKKGTHVVQRKFNGTHVLVNISVDREVGILNRHGEAPRQFSLSQEHINEFLSLNLEEGKEYWLQGELLNNKTKTPEYKNRIVLFDVLQAGRYLFGRPQQMDRLAILDQICKHPTELEPNQGIALKVTENIWMAQTWDKDFQKHYEEFLDLDEIEGVVLREKKNVIDNYGQKEYDVRWMLRVRKPHKNYRF